MTAKYFTCKSCHENTKVKSMATDRVEVERDLGETFLVECSHCHDRKIIHVNDVNAEPNKVITGIGVGIGVVATAVLWQLSVIALASGALPIIIYGAQRKAADRFNAYKIRPTK